MKKGFTLIEVIFAIFILTVSAFGSFSLMQNTLISVSLNESRLAAYYLAQEGIELTRNIRDNNWLEARTSSVDWNNGLTAGEWEIDYNDGYLTVYSGRYFYISDTVDIFSYIDIPSPGDEKTKFRRKITISNLSPEIIKVSAIVYWSERERDHEVEVISYLSNWR